MRHRPDFDRLCAPSAAGEFTGWLDAPLTSCGRRQAIDAGRRMACADIAPDVVHTSLLARSIMTAELALAEAGRLWIPVRRSWRLNERHYGELTGRSKRAVLAEVGEVQYRQWRNSLQVAPPPMSEQSLGALRCDPRYAGLPAELIPATESLGDVDDRLAPYWTDVLVPELAAGLGVLSRSTRIWSPVRASTTHRGPAGATPNARSRSRADASQNMQSPAADRRLSAGGCAP